MQEFSTLSLNGNDYQVKDKFSRIYINVKECGAVGDGVTDDTQAIQEAIDTGKTVFFPNGTYLVSSSLNIANNTKLKGENRRKTIITTESKIDIITKNIDSLYYVEIEDIGIDGKNNATCGINFKNTRESYLTNVLVRNCGIGILFNNSWSNGVVGSEFYYNTDNIVMDSACNDISIIDCKVDFAGNNGLDIKGDSKIHNINVVNSLFQSNGKNGISNISCCTLSIRGCYFENNNLNSNAEGYDIYNASQSVSLINILNCCFFVKNVQASIYIKSGKCINIDNVYYQLNPDGLSSINSIEVASDYVGSFITLNGYSNSSGNSIVIKDDNKNITNFTDNTTVYKNNIDIKRAYASMNIDTLGSGNPQVTLSVDNVIKHRLQGQRSGDILNLDSYNTSTNTLETVIQISGSNTIVPKQRISSSLQINGRLQCKYGDTTARPTDAGSGEIFFDSILMKPIICYGGKWYDFTGTQV